MIADFDTWFASHTWFHENSARQTLSSVYSNLIRSGVDTGLICDVLDDVVAVMKREYGE